MQLLERSHRIVPKNSTKPSRDNELKVQNVMVDGIARSKMQALALIVTRAMQMK